MACTPAFASNEPREKGIPYIRVAATLRTPFLTTPYSPFPTPQRLQKVDPSASRCKWFGGILSGG